MSSTSSNTSNNLSANSTALFLGLDLGTDQLRASLLDADLNLVGVERVEFDDLGFGTQGGIYTTPGEAFTTPVEMWVRALDLLLLRLHAQHPLDRVRCIGGSAQSALVWHSSNSVSTTPRSSSPSSNSLSYSSNPTSSTFPSLPPTLPLHSHFTSAAFSLPATPVAQDTTPYSASGALYSGGASGYGHGHNIGACAGQIYRVREESARGGDGNRSSGEAGNGNVWEKTGRIQTACSFLTSLITGKWVGIGESEACATGMWSFEKQAWDEVILGIVAEGNGNEKERESGQAQKLVSWLGDVDTKGQTHFVSRYLHERYGFNKDTLVTPFIPDYLATYLSLLPREASTNASATSDMTSEGRTPEPTGPDAVLQFGPIDLLMTQARGWVPTEYCQVLVHPATRSVGPRSVTKSQGKTTKATEKGKAGHKTKKGARYIALIQSRNADVPRALRRILVLLPSFSLASSCYLHFRFLRLAPFLVSSWSCFGFGFGFGLVFWFRSFALLFVRRLSRSSSVVCLVASFDSVPSRRWILFRRGFRFCSVASLDSVPSRCLGICFRSLSVWFRSLLSCWFARRPDLFIVWFRCSGIRFAVLGFLRTLVRASGFACSRL
ncbi:hypothetical protein C8J56DRAFT_152817 [Mycena floridula]|nr:hypothetical protein C8J56DRAFT_152817 [Mycena floridula]